MKKNNTIETAGSSARSLETASLDEERSKIRRDNELSDDVPVVVLEAVRLDRECSDLRVRIEQAYQLIEKAKHEQEGWLSKADPTNEKDMLEPVISLNKVTAWTQQIRLLEPKLEATEKELLPVAREATEKINAACATAARGCQEIAAKAIVAHFRSIDDARLASSKIKGVTQWFERQFTYYHGEPPAVSRIVKIARDVYPELQKLREQLGGNIPSAVEMNAFY